MDHRPQIFFCEKTILWVAYLDMRELYVVPPLTQLQPFTFRHDGALPHWSKNVRTFLDQIFPSMKIGHGGPISSPPRSLTISPQQVNLQGHAKGYDYMRNLGMIMQPLRERIIEAVWSVAKGMSIHIWIELSISTCFGYHSIKLLKLEKDVVDGLCFYCDSQVPLPLETEHTPTL
jgi:hypothetical protein